MMVTDYSNEEDYYSQGFEKENVVSIWVGTNTNETGDENIDVLQDLCGIGYYDLDEQESNCFEYKSVNLRDLLVEMSYSNTFIEVALAAASNMGITKATWVILQYNFEYNPSRVKRAIAKEPIFIGSFDYSPN